MFAEDPQQWRTKAINSLSSHSLLFSPASEGGKFGSSLRRYTGISFNSNNKWVKYGRINPKIFGAAVYGRDNKNVDHFPGFTGAFDLCGCKTSEPSDSGPGKAAGAVHSKKRPKNSFFFSFVRLTPWPSSRHRSIGNPFFSFSLAHLSISVIPSYFLSGNVKSRAYLTGKSQSISGARESF